MTAAILPMMTFVKTPISSGNSAMSMDRCVKCDAYVNTDDDPAAYVERLVQRQLVGPILMWDCICEDCRERMLDEADDGLPSDTEAA